MGTSLFAAGPFVGVPGSTALAAVPLSVPYISQYQGQATANYDCGPAAVAMVVQYFGRKPATQSAQAFVSTVRNLTGNPGANSTTFAQLEAALNAYGLPTREISSTLAPAPVAQIQAMRDAVAMGNPVIALVHGATLGRGAKYGDHWVVLTGILDSQQMVQLNDPDSQPKRWISWIQGGQMSVPYSTFQQAALDAEPGPYGIVVGNSTTPAAPPSGNGSVPANPYDGADPYAAGCTDGAYVVKNSVRAITGSGGDELGTIELWWSPRCGVNWGVMRLADAFSPNPEHLPRFISVRRDDGRSVDFTWSGDGSIIWGNVVDGRGMCVVALGQIDRSYDSPAATSGAGC